MSVTTIASQELSLVQGTNMAENVIGLVLLLITYLDNTKISPEEPVYRVNVTKRYRSKINKSHP